jgi:hypothetical protein
MMFLLVHERILILFILFVKLINGNVINIFNDYYHYEFNDLSQSNIDFSYKIDSLPGCSPQSTINFAEEFKKIKKIKIIPSIEIYNNKEDTLSFMILLDIEFSSLSINSNYQMAGFELQFKLNDSTSCVRIYPSNQILTFYNQINKLEIKIKDPIFMDFKNLKYTFYFGQVSSKFLVKCGDESFCVLDESQSESVDIGIKAKTNGLNSKPPEPSNYLFFKLGKSSFH